MKRKLKIALIVMLLLTAIYISAVVYANSISSEGAVDTAFLYHDEPDGWYTPEQMGIVRIEGYNETSTWIKVVYGEQGPLVNPEEKPIFKYRNKFWQISELHVTPAPPESVQWQVPIGGAVVVGWVFIGILFSKERKRKKALVTASALLMLSLSLSPNFSVASATTSPSANSLRVFPALPTEVCEVEPIPQNSTVKCLNTTNPYSNSVSPMVEQNESEGNNPLYVLVFGDDEERNSERQNPPYHYWSAYASNEIERGDEALASTFGIDIRILDFLEWDSDDSKESMYDLWYELAEETGSYLGQWYDGVWWSNYVDAIIGITDQDTPADDPQIAGLAPGPLEIDEGDIFVLLKWQVHWADDNLVQHEVSHLFYADDEYPYCGAMACHTHYQTWIWEDGLWWVFADVLCAYTSYYWDSYNNRTIETYSASYTDDEYTGMLVLRQGPMVFPFTARGTASLDYGVHADTGGTSLTISVESASYGYEFNYWLVNGVTKVYSKTINIYIPTNEKVRLALYFKARHYLPPRRGGGGGTRYCLLR